MEDAGDVKMEFLKKFEVALSEADKKISGISSLQIQKVGSGVKVTIDEWCVFIVLCDDIAQKKFGDFYRSDIALRSRHFLLDAIQDPTSAISNYFIHAVTYHSLEKRILEDQRNEEVRLALEKETRFWELEPYTLRSALETTSLENPVAGIVLNISSNYVLPCGGEYISYCDLKLRDPNDVDMVGTVRIPLRLLGPLKKNETILFKAKFAFPSKAGKKFKILIIEKLKTIEKQVNMWQVLRTRMHDYYKKRGRSELFSKVLEFEIKDPAMERLLCPNGNHDLRTRQARIKKIQRLCEMRLGDEQGYLHRTKDKPLEFQWITKY